MRDRDLLDLASREAAQWLDQTRPTAEAVDKIVTNWSTRFKLIEIG
jgi:hypothetical protein